MNAALPSPLSHAYIITGGSVQSRKAYAQRLAAAYLCESAPQPCGVCRHCVKVEKNIHPDVSWVLPAEGKREILVGQARDVRSDAYVRPNEGERKVYLIDPADSMNPAAQNALLKVLEDGPPYTAFLLLAGQPGRLLETIRSRCETVALPPEERKADPELERRAKELANVLLTGSEWELARACTKLENEKWKSGDLLDLLTAAEPVVARELTRNRRAASVLRVLKSCRDNEVYNVGTGHILGWLCGELFRETN